MSSKVLCLRTVLLALVAIASGCNKTPEPAPPPRPPDPSVAAQTAWNDFAAAFIESCFKAQPFFGSQMGRHEFDGQMPDWSRAALQQEVTRLKDLRAKTQAIDEAPLKPDQRFERQYVLSILDSDLFWMEQARLPYRNPAFYLNQMDPEVYLSRDYAPLEKRLAGYLGYVRAIPKIASDIRANLEPPFSVPVLEHGINGFGGFAEFFRHEVAPVFSSVKDEQAQKELAAADKAAAEAMDALKTWLMSQRKTATQSFALGAPLYAAMLKQTERVEVPLADLEALGQADLARNLETLKAVCAQYLPGGTERACVDKMNANKPKNGSVEGARAMLADLKGFLVAKHVVTIPGDEEARVAEAPPYNRDNFAYINIPGPYEIGVPATYNIAPPDPKWSAKERAEYIPGMAVLTSTSLHEVWPGHFLQFLHARRNPSRIAAIWIGYAYSEGWAHYCEEMLLVEEGYGGGTAELHVGQLSDALLRDVRFLASIGMHTHGMTPQQAEKMFRDGAFQDPGNAHQQAIRGAYEPAYLNYTLGKLMIRKLRTDWVALKTAGNAQADPKQYWQEFHDRFLSYGGPPIPLVRQAMLGEEAANSGSLF
jgi:uncharacterized protein (DUF885 family)